VSETVPRSVEIHADAGELMRAAADAIVEAAAAATRARGRFVIALSGGSTPNALYRLLASDAYARRIDWPRVEIFWGDERCVPPEDPASNYRGARELLLDRVPIDPSRIHRIEGELEPRDAAAAYERALRAAFSTPEGPPRLTPGSRFDFVLLGLGADGHTASLFPHTPALHESRRIAVANTAPVEPSRRVTLTFPALNAARAVLVLTSGADKAPAVARALAPEGDADAIPVRGVRPSAGTLTWLLDAAAAAGLPPRAADAGRG
jgi:6-phosphogluconolactonase